MEEARHWRARHDDELPAREQAYLAAVLSLANRATRLRWVAALGTIALLSLMVLGGSVALIQVRLAERRAVDEAVVAGREAERARLAETQVKAQLDAIRREQEEKRRAQAEVKRGKEDLRVVNSRLEEALGRSEQESQRAREAAASAHRLADSLQKSNGRLEKLLADERARAERLERERRKITTELR
jgi:hypothetical protein